MNANGYRETTYREQETMKALGFEWQLDGVWRRERHFPIHPDKPWREVAYIRPAENRRGRFSSQRRWSLTVLRFQDTRRFADQHNHGMSLKDILSHIPPGGF